MDVKAALEAMREDVEGCDLVMFADLSTQMVLAAASAGRRPQEELDALCGIARETLDGPVAEGAAPMAGGAMPEQAAALTPIDARVFIRSAAAPQEVLICLCTPDADLEAVLEKGRMTLDLIAEVA